MLVSRLSRRILAFFLFLPLLSRISPLSAVVFDPFGVPGGSGQWSFPLDTAFNITLNDSVMFFWENQLTHDLFIVPTSDQCDGSDGEVLVPPTSSGQFVFTPTPEDVNRSVHFVCTIHCMRLTVNVTENTIDGIPLSSLKTRARQPSGVSFVPFAVRFVPFAVRFVLLSVAITLSISFITHSLLGYREKARARDRGDSREPVLTETRARNAV